MIERPQPGEYAPYTVKYFDRVPDGDILEHLSEGPGRVAAAFDRVPDGQFGEPMAPGEWAPAAVLQHMIDDERIYNYRVLRAARGDTTELPGFDQELFAANANAARRERAQMLEEFAAVRAATVHLLRSLAPETLGLIGVAEGKPMSPRAAAWHIAGHEAEHRATVEEHDGWA